MDRRQRKTREAIFNAFTSLLAKKSYANISVREIIDSADVGRATFYAHFETKDFLLKELCEELFCHVSDMSSGTANDHRHIFTCDSEEAPFLHLIRHIEKNDNKILDLLSSQNNELFLRYFKEKLRTMTESCLPMFAPRKSEKLPDDFWADHVSSTFVNTVSWWIDGGRRESAETVYEYFMLAV